MMQMIKHIIVFVAIMAVASLFAPLLGILLASWAAYFMNMVLEIERVEAGCDA